ncbi:hypothetical protein Scep_024367 [Stephania cephalantha]|uniref:Protein NRT1/ PTR FAMILY 1.2-like n=1 Tax=Stephania cephalantha TaxID=152367 RepID=A0AAP0F1V8_9MAGN
MEDHSLAETGTEKMSGTTMNKQESSRLKGGLISMPFIIANEAFEKVASFGLLNNMIIYLITGYNMGYAKGANVLFLWSAVSNFMPILGAFISDSYLGRFLVITLGSVSSLAGMVLLWLTAMLPSAKPNPGEHPSHAQLCLLFGSFVLMSIGAGGIRPCSLAFGADQFNKEDNPNNTRVLQSFFNWYYASVGVSIMIAVTLIVYIQDKFGWKVGFGVPAALMLLSTFTFLLGFPLYVRVMTYQSLLTTCAQVVVAASKNRGLKLPSKVGEGWFHQDKDSKIIVVPSEKLRFLNKACIIRNRDKELDSDGSALDPWRLCTVTQVEDLKSVIRVLPIWSTGIMIAVTISQVAFPVLQAKTMNRHLTSKFQIPAGSFSVFGILTLTIWVAIYDRILVPIIAKHTGRTRGLTNKQRMGTGLVISCMALTASALVENARRTRAIREGLIDNPVAVVDMSAMWLIIQHCLTGLAEAFNAIGQIEFYYSQLPKTMGSIAVALFTLGMAVGNLVGSLIVSVLDEVTKKGGRESWVTNNLNRGRYDNYYWVLAILCALNFVYFLGCCWLYGDEDDELLPVLTKAPNEGYEVEEKDLEK